MLEGEAFAEVQEYCARFGRHVGEAETKQAEAEQAAENTQREVAAAQAAVLAAQQRLQEANELARAADTEHSRALISTNRAGTRMAVGILERGGGFESSLAKTLFALVYHGSGPARRGEPYEQAAQRGVELLGTFMEKITPRTSVLMWSLKPDSFTVTAAYANEDTLAAELPKVNRSRSISSLEGGHIFLHFPGACIVNSSLDTLTQKLNRSVGPFDFAVLSQTGELEELERLLANQPPTDRENRRWAAGQEAIQEAMATDLNPSQQLAARVALHGAGIEVEGQLDDQAANQAIKLITNALAHSTVEGEIVGNASIDLATAGLLANVLGYDKQRLKERLENALTSGPEGAGALLNDLGPVTDMLRRIDSLLTRVFEEAARPVERPGYFDES